MEEAATGGIAYGQEVLYDSGSVKPIKPINNKQKRNLPLAYDDPKNFCKFCDKRGFKSLNCKSSHETGCKKKQGLPTHKKKPAVKQPCVVKVPEATAQDQSVGVQSVGFPRVGVKRVLTSVRNAGTVKRRVHLAHTHGSFGFAKARKARLITHDTQFDPAKHCLACRRRASLLSPQECEVPPRMLPLIAWPLC
eukprot:2267267-Pyramimonas_sp.AAC.1